MVPGRQAELSVQTESAGTRHCVKRACSGPSKNHKHAGRARCRVTGDHFQVAVTRQGGFFPHHGRSFPETEHTAKRKQQGRALEGGGGVHREGPYLGV